MRPTNADAAPAGGDASPKVSAASVHLQLARVLASPHFRNSKRSQSLLRYVVEAQLAGEADSLKERCIGAAVFSRDTAYDTAQDPIVRNAAIDVRKRLAQYYLEHQHSFELRIELPTGSYQPVFVPETQLATVEAPRLDVPPIDVPPVDLPRLDAPLRELSAAPPPPPPRRVGKRAFALAATASLLLAAAGTYLWFNQRSPATELDAFWEPLFRDGKTIQICIGQPTRLFRFIGPRTEELTRALSGPAARSPEAAALTVKAAELAWVAPEFLYLRDALSGFRVASWIQAKGRPYELVSVASTTYSQLRHTPLVAIGAFNNTWSLRVTAELRFLFERRTVNGVAYNCIIDRRSPATPLWKVAQPISPTMSEDFAIVTRVFDPSTERTVISVAGIENYGTLAAGEFVTQPDYIGAALAANSPQWRRQNVQFVLGTKVIDGTPGPPRVLAVHYW
ncbi:MAG: hypothetical protein JNK87_14675 [Bryobacterales bacterium]|nr:hypothetical protein [Bryobacterales bacterium]